MVHELEERLPNSGFRRAFQNSHAAFSNEDMLIKKCILSICPFFPLTVKGNNIHERVYSQYKFLQLYLINQIHWLKYFSSINVSILVKSCTVVFVLNKMPYFQNKKASGI
jgi:hypothetical protein